MAGKATSAISTCDDITKDDTTMTIRSPDTTTESPHAIGRETIRAAAVQHDRPGPRWLLRTRRHGLLPRSRTRVPVVLWAMVLRLVVLIADYLLAFVTATVVVPMFAAWLHQQSGAAAGNLTAAGAFAMWLTPLLFLVAILAAGEIAAMRALWHWSTRSIKKTRDRHVSEHGGSAPTAPPQPHQASGKRHSTKKKCGRSR
ncbi:hypothetical protein [Amycolatopsis sp. PS_44_ISF1]|uniref:hypothetical protein n=1 Tax=Amycolatopsis sp. PS_44_ISF1 TaxID=2974917 RepID=UPI0028DDB933|nr:hypothetical protein [Amycolatopsis sp. PS_44_ISF1]MDT8913570.1 hypothetical protein [Amycolatopsis sp. PS_44_ISF1]